MNPNQHIHNVIRMNSCCNVTNHSKPLHLLTCFIKKLKVWIKLKFALEIIFLNFFFFSLNIKKRFKKKKNRKKIFV